MQEKKGRMKGRMKGECRENEGRMKGDSTSIFKVCFSSVQFNLIRMTNFFGTFRNAHLDLNQLEISTLCTTAEDMLAASGILIVGIRLCWTHLTVSTPICIRVYFT